jgi:hypothetical protein
VAELKNAILDYLDRHNADPKPFVWTKTAEIILEKERRALDRLERSKPGAERQSRNIRLPYQIPYLQVRPSPDVPHWATGATYVRIIWVSAITARVTRASDHTATVARVCDYK